MSNYFDWKDNTDLLKRPIPFLVVIALMALIGFVLIKQGIAFGVGVLMLPFVVTYIFLVLKEPRIGLMGLFIINYFILGVSRYIDGIPYGLAIDFHLVLILLSLFFRSFFNKVPWKRAWNDLFILALIWFIWILFQLLNPMATTRSTWFSSMRGIGLYMFLTIPIIFITFNKKEDLKTFFIIWGVMSILASLKGIIQQHIGVDPWEQAWLDGGGALTHIVRGKLRVFSFMTDAGQYGASQGHSGIVFMLLAANQKKSSRLRVFYAITGLLALYGMMISGTRGAIAVPIMGLALYTLLQGNIKAIIIGGLVGLAVIGFFTLTTIGNSNYTINRMRTAFNPNDASFQVRLNNQRILRSYMASRPIGTGLGSTSAEAKRIAPNSLAAQVPTDSWYVMIWVEQGIIGLTLHLFILLYILIKSSLIIFFKLKDPWIKAQMSALAAGLFGIMVASYGNGVLGQMPTGIIIYSSMAFLFLAQEYEVDINENSKIIEKALPN